MRRIFYLLFCIIYFQSVNAQLFINEYSAANYDSYQDNYLEHEDWVEIYNNSSETVDLSLWQLKDENDDHIFTIPLKTMLMPDQYIVFCKDTIKFIELFPNVEFYYGDLGFGLSGASDQIRLFDSTGTLADTVEYDDDLPWPTIADGGGPTLELKNPSLDNADWESWSPSQGNGTPGALNSTFNSDI